jgi:hypothetical protein
MMDLFLSQAFFISIAIALSSMVLHSIKKWTMGEIRGSVIDWYLVNPRRSVGSLLGCITGVVTLVLSGGVTDLSIGAEIVALAGVGFAADTLNTQDQRKQPR